MSRAIGAGLGKADPAADAEMLPWCVAILPFALAPRIWLIGWMIEITGHIAIDESEIEESFIRASGPGGQNVNKVASAVQIRFNLMASPSLPDDLKERAARLAGRRLTKDGVIVITAARFRTQERNREDAEARLVEILREASIRPVIRRATRPTLASKRRRLDAKTRRSSIKAMRGPAGSSED